MGCGSGASGKIRSAGVFVVSIIFSTRTPGSITRESIAPRIRAATAAATSQLVVRALMTSNGNPIVAHMNAPFTPIRRHLFLSIAD